MYLLGLVKGKMWRIPLSLSLFLLAPNVQSSEIQMETMNTISVQFSNVSLSEAMSQIEKASGYSFFYDANKVDLSVRVSLNASNESLREVLNTIFDSTGLTYEISQNQFYCILGIVGIIQTRLPIISKLNNRRKLLKEKSWMHLVNR